MPLPEQSYERLLDLIVRGRIPPGARIIEAELALRFGVSRTPIRGAVARLAQEGYLVPSSTFRRTEFVVAPLYSEGVHELWRIIGALEGLAASLVAQLARGRRQAITSDMRRLNQELAKAGSRPSRDPDLLFDLQSRFHGAFVSECGSPRLIAIHGGVRPHVQRYEWAFGTQQSAEIGPSVKEHERMISSIAKGAPDRAKTAVESHWAEAAQRTSGIIASIAPNASLSLAST